MPLPRLVARHKVINQWYFNRDWQPLSCGSGVLSASSKKFHGTF